MKNSIRRAFRRWFGRGKDAVDGGAQAYQSRQIASQMRDDGAVRDKPTAWADRHQSAGLQGDLADSVEQPKGAGVFKVDEWRAAAGDAGNLTRIGGNVLGDDWRRYCGFVGQDNVPWLWDDDKQDWRPVTETRFAARYAAQRRA